LVSLLRLEVITFNSIVLEYCDNGDLFQKITKAQKDQQWIPEEEIWKIFIQMVRGLRVLH